MTDPYNIMSCCAEQMFVHHSYLHLTGDWAYKSIHVNMEKTQ